MSEFMRKVAIVYSLGIAMISFYNGVESGVTAGIFMAAIINRGMIRSRSPYHRSFHNDLGDIDSDSCDCGGEDCDFDE